LLGSSNSDDETNFGVCIAVGDANPKIGFLKVLRLNPERKCGALRHIYANF